jgi:hypothetical protein
LARAVPIWLAAVSACGDNGSDLPSDQSWSSAHFDYHTRLAETRACADVLGPLEQHFATLQAYLGFAWPEGQKVEYEKFVDDADELAHGGCPDGRAGCAPGTSVLSAAVLDEHELVHAYLYPTGFPPPVLQEGAAEALSCDALLYTKPALGPDDLAGLSAVMPDAQVTYGAGAWLVGYLLDQLGPLRFVQLYGMLGHHASTAEMDAAFRAVYGQGLADLWAAAISEDHPRNTCVWECSQPAIALDGNPVPTDGTCGVEVRHPFTLGAEASISFTTTANMGVRGCGAVNLPLTTVVGHQPVLALYHLPAETYFVEHDPGPGMLVGKGDVSATLGSDCASVTDTTGLAPGVNVYVAVPRADTPWFLAAPPGSGVDVILTGPGEAAQRCVGCNAGSNLACTNATGQVIPPGGDVLVLTPSASQAFSDFALILETASPP